MTIPKSIWERLHLRVGTRFGVILTEDHKIYLEPRADDLDLTDEEWTNLLALAHDRRNVSKRFKSARKALDYLKRL